MMFVIVAAVWENSYSHRSPPTGSLLCHNRKQAEKWHP